MDFSSNRGVQPSTSRTAATSERSSSNNKMGDDKKRRDMRGTPKWLKVSSVLLLFAGTIIVIGIIALLLVNPGNEARLVEKDKYQAVFLDNGQVYFGRINSMNNSHIDLVSIYYLNVDDSIQPTDGTEANQNVTLKKLGCELHGPTDRMVINREHVVFWENLRSDAKVTEAITEWVGNNPDGLVCDQNNSTTETEGTTENEQDATNGNEDSSTDDANSSNEDSNTSQ